MTTKNISTISLPRPKCSLQVGNILIDPDQTRKSSWIPKFSDTMQIVEVRRTGSTRPNQLADDMKRVIGSYILIDNVRPELFLRRDFIKKFVHNGAVHLSQAAIRDESDYRICSINNELQITLNEKQYRRFGLIGKKIIPSRAKNAKQYLVACDLKDERIIRSNKFQDKLVQTFRRLSALKQVYFRFVPSSTDLSISKATSDALSYFLSVLDEYAADGFKPVPLTGCCLMRQQVQKKWLNCSQLHPDLSPSKTDGVVDIVDWVGYQLLGINCDKEEIRNRYPDEQERLDVSCLQICGMVDFKHVQEILSDIFSKPSQEDTGSNDIVMRALCLYGTHPKNSNLMIMQNFSRPIIGSNGSLSLTVAKTINY